MPTHFIHKSFYIDVRIIRRDSSDSELFEPQVVVGPEGGNHAVSIATSRAFVDEQAAEAYGFKLGREWIDRKVDPCVIQIKSSSTASPL